MERSTSDFDRSELERIANELGYDSFDVAPLPVRNNIRGSLRSGGIDLEGDFAERLLSMVEA